MHYPTVSFRFINCVHLHQLLLLEEELVARKSFWRRSAGPLEELSAALGEIHHSMLISDVQLKIEPIKQKMNAVFTISKELSQVR